MTWTEFYWSLIALPVLLAGARIVLIPLERWPDRSKWLYRAGYYLSALCVVLAITWWVNAEVSSWKPPANNEDDVGGLLPWTLLWNALTGTITTTGLRTLDFFFPRRSQ